MEKFDRLLSFTAWTYALATITVLALMYLAGDRWWLGTMVLFGPRWALVLPLIALIPLALWRRPGLLLPLLMGGAVAIGPFMGMHYYFTTADLRNVQVLRVLSCNVGGKNFNASALSKLIQDLDVDIVTLQECKRALNLDLPKGWNLLHPGGISVFSKYPLRALAPVAGMHLPDTWPINCLLPSVISTPHGEIAFNAVHMPTARYGLENILNRETGLDITKTGYLTAETQNRLHVSQSIRNVIKSQTLPLIIAGDFNMPVESSIYRQHWSSLDNAFYKTGRGFGWTSYSTTKKIPIPLRIDHILTGNGIKTSACAIGPDIGSDHRPIIADVHIEQP